MPRAVPGAWTSGCLNVVVALVAGLPDVQDDSGNRASRVVDDPVFDHAHVAVASGTERAAGFASGAPVHVGRAEGGRRRRAFRAGTGRRGDREYVRAPELFRDSTRDPTAHDRAVTESRWRELPPEDSARAGFR
jgi:hypothetical protein